MRKTNPINVFSEKRRDGERTFTISHRSDFRYTLSEKFLKSREKLFRGKK